MQTCRPFFIHMDIEVGKCYFRKVASRATVRKVLKIDNDYVEYETLYGPILKRQRYGNQRLRNFKRWPSGATEELADYSHLDGAILWETYIVRNTKGEPILRCGAKRAKFYLRKGYVEEVEPKVLQFTNDITERRLDELYEGTFNDFFMAVKNDRCVCCGKNTMLSRHHVVPSRAIKVMPQPWRSCISNILFVCIDCHKAYEQYVIDNGEPDIKLGDDPLQFAREWRDHFLTVMKPQHIPKGWDIVSVRNVDAARKYNYGPEPTCGTNEDCGQAESA